MLNQFASSFLLMPIRRKNVATVVSRLLGYSALGGLLTLQQQRTSMMMMNATTLCESSDDSNKSFFDTLLPKDKDGKICWDKAPQQVTDSIFWDKIAKAAGQQLQGALDSGVPTHLSYGFVSGFCSGLALKKVGKAVSVVLGLGFISLQTLSFYGYVKVDHGQMQKDFNDLLDFNKDGGIDRADGEVAYNKLMNVLQFNLPAGGGFAAGFLFGVRSG